MLNTSYHFILSEDVEIERTHGISTLGVCRLWKLGQFMFCVYVGECAYYRSYVYIYIVQIIRFWTSMCMSSKKKNYDFWHGLCLHVLYDDCTGNCHFTNNIHHDTSTWQQPISSTPTRCQAFFPCTPSSTNMFKVCFNRMRSTWKDDLPWPMVRSTPKRQAGFCDSIQKRPKMWVKDRAAITETAETAACRPVPLVVLHWCCPATGSKDETWPVDAQKPGENRPAMGQVWEKEMPILINCH